MVGTTLKELIDGDDIVFMGSDGQPDPTAEDSPLPGMRYVGEKPCVNCNDLFFWGCADAENINEELMVEFNQAVSDCGDLRIGAELYCARRREMRPQGACYSYYDKALWPLFDACGPERDVGFGNPYKPGDYKRRA